MYLLPPSEVNSRSTVQTRTSRCPPAVAVKSLRAPAPAVWLIAVFMNPNMPIEELPVSARLLGLLKRAGCRSVADVVTRWPVGIRRVNRIGPLSMRELHQTLTPLIPDILPVPQSSRPRRRALVTAPHFRDHRRRALEREQIGILRMFLRGMSTRQIAEQHHCPSPAVYARRRRLLLHYVRRPYLQSLPKDLQGFVLAESKKFLIARLARHPQSGATTAERILERLPRRSPNGRVRP